LDKTTNMSSIMDKLIEHECVNIHKYMNVCSIHLENGL
jgi:hypothetical protein